jgi:hypothetical protein
LAAFVAQAQEIIFPPPANLPLPKAEQVPHILQTSQSIPQIVAALKQAAVTPQLRPMAQAFLDSPHNGKIRVNMYSSWDDWGKAMPDYKDLTKFFAQHDDPAIFALYTHFAESDLYISNALAEYGPNVQPGSAAETLYLNYLRDSMVGMNYVIYEIPDQQPVYGGLMNMRTGKFTDYLTPAQQAALPGTRREIHRPYAGETAAGIMAELHSDRSIAILLQLLQSGEAVGTINGMIIPLQPIRYHPDIIAFYRKALAAAPAAAKQDIAWGLLSKGFAVPIDGGDMPAVQLDEADPSVYPQAFAFIADAEKVPLDPSHAQIVGDAKAKLLALAAKHGVKLDLASLENPPSKTPPALAPTAKPSPPPASAAPSHTLVILAASALAALGLLLWFRRR